MQEVGGAGTLLYHEQQVSSLCGLHCINTLLQGPYLTEFDLAHHAQQLDQLEKQVAGNQLIPNEFNEESANVRADGMFSVQVLQMALEVWDIKLIPLRNPRMSQAAQEPAEQEAFVCNLAEHWFTLRKIDSKWWNFDSVKRAPEPLSQFYLSVFLATIQDEGYTVFVVVVPPGGQLPRPGGIGQEVIQNQNQKEVGGRWFTQTEATAESKLGEKIRSNARIGMDGKNGFINQGSSNSFSNDEQDQINAAIQASLGNNSTGNNENGEFFSEEQQLINSAIMESLSNSNQSNQDNNSGKQNENSKIDYKEVVEKVENVVIDGLDDVDFEKCEKDQIVELGFRLSDGTKKIQQFLKSHKIRTLKQFIQFRLKIDLKIYDLVSQFPRRIIDLNSENKLLGECGIVHREIFLFDKSSK
eukprot:TRINITY_DN4498_c0_g1_i1.p1 TRINITY_DN4498_c0_g1~~TRINITY_DN4498_c0_g1_i1.p1  ORF type:complete len:413 (+),score=62.54 TRINITY_DN4498_c0_g1_i1:213-1451(+)